MIDWRKDKWRRAERIVHQRRRGRPVPNIAQDHGISTPRVYQLIHQYSKYWDRRISRNYVYVPHNGAIYRLEWHEWTPERQYDEINEKRDW